MIPAADFEIFLAVAPGFETVLRDEAREKGFNGAKAMAGGVTLKGGWPDVWRANLELRGAARVIARIGAFRVLHLAQLDKRARKFAWGGFLRAEVPIRVEATCKASKIYHSGAAAERIARAIHETLGCPLSDEAQVVIKARIDDDLCTLSIDTSGEPLHKRGHRQEVAKAPMRENLAALFLRRCGYDGREPVLDPMCGSGTFVIEAAEIAAGLLPGRSRAFAFEQLATFDAGAWALMRAEKPVRETVLRFYGSDRDAGAVRMSRANATRAGVAGICAFEQVPVEELKAPEGPPGLVIVNPPYGDRIGKKGNLLALYRTLGHTLKTHFKGWRVAIIATDPDLAGATGLPFKPPFGPISHGGLRVKLFQTPILS